VELLTRSGHRLPNFAVMHDPEDFNPPGLSRAEASYSTRTPNPLSARFKTASRELIGQCGYCGLTASTACSAFTRPAP
jgi:hypothetical protein